MTMLVRAALSVALSATLAATAAAQPAPPPSPAPQAPSDTWTVTVAPYLVGAGLSGTVGLAGYESQVEVPSSDVLKHLKAGFMGFFGAEKRGWGFGADAFYAKLGSEVTVEQTTIDPTATVGLYTFLASRRLAPAATLVFGARVTRVSATIAETTPPQREVSGSKTWVDPVVGVNVVVPAGTKVKIAMLADFGGFGTASTFSTDLLPEVRFRLAKHVWLGLGYRYIYDNYTDDAGFVYKVAMQGPAFGLVIPF